MNRTTKKTWVLPLAAAMVVAGLGTAYSLRSLTRRSSDEARGDAAGQSHDAAVGGINPRTVDPAGALWVAAGEDREHLSTIARDALSVADMLKGDYDVHAVVDEWAHSFAVEEDGDTTFADKIVDCRIRHEAEKGRDCVLGQRLVVKNEGAGDGRVVFVESRAPENAGKSCRALRDCVREAWKNRRVGFPEESPVGGDGYFAFKVGVYGIAPTDDPSFDMKQAYEKARDQSRSSAEYAKTKLKEQDHPALRHMVLFNEAAAEDAERMLHALEKDEK